MKKLSKKDQAYLKWLKERSNKLSYLIAKYTLINYREWVRETKNNKEA